ncbi:MAG: hypothetical protein J6P58_03500 [Oscillospiraceae bacterium]|nr:hypothetical protein [Oscillospiraceae bacterium]
MRKTLCLLLLVCLLLPLCACGREAATYPVSLWLSEDDPLASAMTLAVEEYNRTRKASAPPLALRRFESAAALEQALGTARPDLLLCSHTLSFALDERALLTNAGVSVSYPEAVAYRAEGIGRSVYPIGSRVQLLCSAEEPPAGFGALCARAAAYGAETRLPFLGADSYADLLCQLVLASGEFHADRERDCFSEAFRAGWNALADAAFSGGLYVGEADAFALLRSALPAVIVYSDALASGVPEGRALSLLCPEGTPLLADQRTLAVLSRDGRQQRGAAAFLRWFFSGDRAAKLALSCALIPALPGGEGADALSSLLLSLRERTLWLADGGSDYIRNRAAFEQDFRKAMDLLK